MSPRHSKPTSPVQAKPDKPKNVKRDPVASGDRDASVNRAASHNFFLQDKFEAGVVLTGTEVKSIRAGRVNLKDAYGLIKDGELWLLNAHIGAYEHGSYFNHAPLRTRKLLVHREELRKLIGKTQQKGFTLVPTRLYFRRGRQNAGSFDCASPRRGFAQDEPAGGFAGSTERRRKSSR